MRKAWEGVPWSRITEDNPEIRTPNSYILAMYQVAMQRAFVKLMWQQVPKEATTQPKVERLDKMGPVEVTTLICKDMTESCRCCSQYTTTKCKKSRS